MPIDVLGAISFKGNDINEGIKEALKGINKTFTVSMVDIDELEPSEDNFYSMSDMEELQESIESFGVQQNLIAMKRGNDEKYEIIAGHRRYQACKKLVDAGKKEFSNVPCRLLPTISDTLKNILIIHTNSETRKKTSWEITEEIERLKILYKDYKKENPNFKGDVRVAVAKETGLSTSTIGRHENISNNLTEPLKQQYKEGKIGISQADKIASLSEDQQKEAHKIIEEKGEIKTSEIKEIKEDTKEQAVINDYTEPENQITNECGIYLPEHITKTKLDIPPKYGDITIEIAFDERDNKYRHGYSYNDKNSGCGYMPSHNCKPFNTEKDAFNDMIAKLQAQDKAIEKALTAGGYIPEDKPKVQVREFQIVDTETTIQEPIEPALSETEIIIIALTKNREAVIREIEKIPVNNEDSGRVTVNGVRLARWTMIKQIFDNELKELSGSNIFEEAEHE